MRETSDLNCDIAGERRSDKSNDHNPCNDVRPIRGPAVLKQGRKKVPYGPTKPFGLFSGHWIRLSFICSLALWVPVLVIVVNETLNFIDCILKLTIVCSDAIVS